MYNSIFSEYAHHVYFKDQALLFYLALIIFITFMIIKKIKTFSTLQM